jgi:hypothetical protein
MSEFVEMLSRLLGVSIPAISAALAVSIPMTEMLKKLLPKVLTLFGKEFNTGLVLACVVGLLTGGYAQYAVVSPDGLIPLEYLSIAWGGVVAFLLGAGWYSAVKTQPKTEITYLDDTSEM